MGPDRVILKNDPDAAPFCRYIDTPFTAEQAFVVYENLALVGPS
jgi:hypothetical protein